MISKKFRLRERELKKVLQKGKPFFSYGVVLNYCQNTFWFHRYGIVVSGKSVSSNVTRNYFRRFFYSKITENKVSSSSQWFDFVYVVKKEKRLDKKDEKSIKDFAQDISFLQKKIEITFKK